MHDKILAGMDKEAKVDTTYTEGNTYSVILNGVWLTPATETRKHLTWETPRTVDLLFSLSTQLNPPSFSMLMSTIPLRVPTADGAAAKNSRGLLLTEQLQKTSEVDAVVNVNVNAS